MSIYVSFVGCVMRLLVNAEKFGRKCLRNN